MTAVHPAPTAARSSGVAWGKVILLGEHSVVYGRRALAAAISRRIEVCVGDVYSSARRNGIGNGDGTSPLGNGDGTSPLGNGDGTSPLGNGDGASPLGDPRFRAAVVRAAELLDLDASDLVVSVESDLPPGVGLGSSAALSVALVRALAAFAGADCCNAEVCAHAYELERIFHGTPSGIDNTAATHGGLFVFRRGEPPRQLAAPVPLPLVVAVGKTPRQTQATVAAVRQRWQAEPQAYEMLFDRIDALVGAAEAALAAGDLAALGAAMDTNHELLQRIGVSTAELDELVAFGRARGALGAKLTGGGGGGAIIALCRDGTESASIAAAYRDAGWGAFTTVVEATVGERRAQNDTAAGVARRHLPRGGAVQEGRWTAK